MMQHEVATSSVPDQQAKRFTLGDGHGTRIVLPSGARVRSYPTAERSPVRVQRSRGTVHVPRGRRDAVAEPSRAAAHGDPAARCRCRAVGLHAGVAARLPGGQERPEFATIAIKTKSQGFVVDHAGAEFTYEVVSLSGVAEGIVLSL